MNRVLYRIFTHGLEGELPASCATIPQGGRREPSDEEQDSKVGRVYYRHKVYFHISSFYFQTLRPWSERTRPHSRERAKSLYRIRGH
jgi:hypothetical protein